MSILTKTTKVEFQLNNKPITADILIEVDMDEWPEGDFDFGDEAENEAYLKRFETGELLCVSIVVTASIPGINPEGMACLGMCHIRDSRIEDDVMDLIRTHDLIPEAVEDLQRNLIKILEILN